MSSNVLTLLSKEQWLQFKNDYVACYPNQKDLNISQFQNPSSDSRCSYCNHSPDFYFVNFVAHTLQSRGDALQSQAVTLQGQARTLQSRADAAEASLANEKKRAKSLEEAILTSQTESAVRSLSLDTSSQVPPSATIEDYVSNIEDPTPCATPKPHEPHSDPFSGKRFGDSDIEFESFPLLSKRDILDRIPGLLYDTTSFSKCNLSLSQLNVHDLSSFEYLQIANMRLMFVDADTLVPALIMFQSQLCHLRVATSRWGNLLLDSLRQSSYPELADQAVKFGLAYNKLPVVKKDLPWPNVCRWVVAQFNPPSFLRKQYLAVFNLQLSNFSDVMEYISHFRALSRPLPQSHGTALLKMVIIPELSAKLSALKINPPDQVRDDLNMWLMYAEEWLRQRSVTDAGSSALVVKS